jgi:DNA-binding transcriptional ArsR family regulator
MTNANAALDSLAALGDPTRRAIFERVAARPAAVGARAAGQPPRGVAASARAESGRAGQRDA